METRIWAREHAHSLTPFTRRVMRAREVTRVEYELLKACKCSWLERPKRCTCKVPHVMHYFLVWYHIWSAIRYFMRHFNVIDASHTSHLTRSLFLSPFYWAIHFKRYQLRQAILIWIKAENYHTVYEKNCATTGLSPRDLRPSKLNCCAWLVMLARKKSPVSARAPLQQKRQEP